MNDSDIETVFRNEAGRVLATLIRLLGDFDRAEEALQDALAAAVALWPDRGVPDNPRAWLVAVGRNGAFDRLRRERFLRDKQHLIETELLPDAPPAAADLDDRLDDDFGDDILRLIFTCCHPALSLETRVALTLRAVCGLSTEAIARAFLVGDSTMAQRLVRAKQKIRTARIPYETPAPGMLDERLESVLSVIYLVFTEGYSATSGEDLIRHDLAREAIRLGRLVHHLLPERAAISGLLALLLLHDARRSARETDEGDIVLLEDQDRSLWDRAQIAEGLALVDAALRLPGLPSAYAVQAAIAALHARAPRYEETDWRQIVGLYEVLLRLHPTPVIELNHAAALSMVDGPARALARVDSLAARGSLADYHLLHAVRADLLRRMGRHAEARIAYLKARDLARLAPQRRLIDRRLAELG